ncbi:hypothetical protein [Solibacillus sp. CAU 1738]|uniref:hypothetical protein n=1 Tax=Solibacillus sp. CAU 1738 TaxID=3140363 RepID=UPI00326104AA
MKKMIILIFVITLLAPLSKANAMNSEYVEVAKSDTVDVSLYAKKTNGMYTDFKIDFQGSILSKPSWENVANPTWSPQIISADINQDGVNELIIILTTGTGTGVIEREAHVFHLQKQRLRKKLVEVPVEVLVDDPIAIVLKNVKTELYPSQANINIGNKKYSIDLKPFNIEPEHLFNNINFGNMINFEVQDNQLIAKIGGQIAPAGGYIGNIIITYWLKDNMYQAKSIVYEQYE